MGVGGNDSGWGRGKGEEDSDSLMSGTSNTINNLHSDQREK